MSCNPDAVQALDYAILHDSNVLDRLLDLADHPQASHAAAGILLVSVHLQHRHDA